VWCPGSIFSNFLYATINLESAVIFVDILCAFFLDEDKFTWGVPSSYDKGFISFLVANNESMCYSGIGNYSWVAQERWTNPAVVTGVVSL